MAAGVVVQLLAPGLLGPWPQAVDPGFPLPKTPALRRLLAVADRGLARPDPDAALFELFGVPWDPAAGPPVAAVGLLGEGGEPEDGWWLRADPVHLVPDLQRLRLAEPTRLALLLGEAQLLAQAANQVLAAHGLALTVVAAERWYLRLGDDPGLCTRPWAPAVGESAEALLPTGAGAPQWRRMLTEVQMALHTATANVQREARGLPPVNAIWVWGGGRLPAVAGATPVAAVCGDQPVLRGLARLFRLPVHPNLHSDIWLGAGKSQLVAREDAAAAAARAGDLAAWVRAVEQLECRVFQPLLAALRSGQVAELNLNPLRGTLFSISRRCLRRFWRADRSLRGYL